jgi:hypothetical protein
VHYRISAANRRSVCPPQCIRPVPLPRAIGPEIFARSRHATRHAIADPSGFDLPRSMQVDCTLSIVAGCGVRVALPASHDRPARTNATVAAPPGPPSSRQRISKTPGTASATQADATRGDLLRANASLGRAALVAPVVARAVFELREARPLIQEFLARMIEVPRTAISIAVHTFQRARLASCSRGNIEIISTTPRKTSYACGREFRTRRRAECVRRFTISSCR